MFGSDNIRDPFNPLGSPDVIQNATLTAYACHMASSNDFSKLLEMVTIDAAKVMKLDKYGLQAGCNADFNLVDAVSIEELLAKQSQILYTLKNGEILTSNSITRQRHFRLAS